MFKAKYIVYNNNKNDTEDIVVFTILQNHCDVATNLPGNVISAGFVKFVVDDDNIKAMCYDRSDTLDIDSRPADDSQLANILLLNTF